jgi:hypothetical protein
VLEVRQATEADMSMDTSPDSPPVATTVRIPPWQLDLGAVLVERLFTVELVGSIGRQIVNSSANGNSPSPPMTDSDTP